MEYKLGFIGCGNMAVAMMGGMIKSGLLKPEEIIASDISETAMMKVQEDLGINVTKSNQEVAGSCEILILSVKPQYYEAVISEVAAEVLEKTVIVTIAPGITIKKLNSLFGKDVKLIRTMPNTPALVGEGMTGICRNHFVSDEEMADVCRLFNGFGKTQIVDEKVMDAVVAVSGSSPAYVFILIEAMADAAVSGGMARNQAYTFAAQAVAGSAKMVLETGRHPGELKDMVCSPGGTTIEAVRVLEQQGFRSSVIEAMEACMKKSSDFS